MFGYVMANLSELSKEERHRYQSVYCGICHGIGGRNPGAARMALSFDLVFLALLLMSLYEPEERKIKGACLLHPLRSYTENEIISYCADMNVALAYYKAADDVSDEGHLRGKVGKNIFGKAMPQLQSLYPRQCRAMEEHLEKLRLLEKENCENPDLPAGVFGDLLGEIFAYRQDLWEPALRNVGRQLGRYIYLADAAADYRRDEKKGQYNPFLAMETGENYEKWEQYLVQAMGHCVDSFERLPLVQDKKILDNILYSGVWIAYRRKTGRKQNEKSL